MNWTSAYRLAAHLLPAPLRRKHGRAMETLFARELERARERGRLQGALAGAAGLWDLVRRAAYEQSRPARRAGTDRDGPHASPPTVRQLLCRHAASFATALVTLTSSLLAIFAKRQLPALTPPGTSTSVLAEVLLLSVPFIAALTIPMAVFIAVLWEFTRLRLDGTLAAARSARDGVRRLIVPVLGAAAGVAALAFVVTAEIVPRTNSRLTTLLAMRTTEPNARTMTLGELREAERNVRPSTGPAGLIDELVKYEIEVHKKFALAAACMVLAFAGVAIALRAPRAGATLVIGASCAVFGAYYWLFMTGESLAAHLVVPPFVGMWGADALVLAVALLTLSTDRARLASDASGAAVLRG